MLNTFGYDVTHDDVDHHLLPQEINTNVDRHLAEAVAESAVAYAHAAQQHIKRQTRDAQATGSMRRPLLNIHAGNHLTMLQSILHDFPEQHDQLEPLTDAFIQESALPDLLSFEDDAAADNQRGLNAFAGAAQASHSISQAKANQQDADKLRAHSQAAFIALQPIMDAVWPPEHDDRPGYPVPDDRKVAEALLRTRRMAEENWAMMSASLPVIYSPGTLGDTTTAQAITKVRRHLEHPGIYLLLTHFELEDGEADAIVLYNYQGTMYVRRLSERPHHHIDHRSAYRMAVQINIMACMRAAEGRDSEEVTDHIQQAVETEIGLAAVNMHMADPAKITQLLDLVQKITGSPLAHRAALKLLHQDDPAAVAFIEQFANQPKAVVPAAVAEQIRQTAVLNGASDYVVRQIMAALGHEENPQPATQDEIRHIAEAVGCLSQLRDFDGCDIEDIAEILGCYHPDDVEAIMTWVGIDAIGK